MSILVAIGASFVAAGAAGAAIVNRIRAYLRIADRDQFLLMGCWIGIGLMGASVAWDQWDRVLA